MYLRTRLQQLLRSVQWGTWESAVVGAAEGRVLACASCVPSQARKLPWTSVGLGFAAASLAAIVSPSGAACSPAAEVDSGSAVNLAHGGMRAESQKPKVIFVLGGPGSGKGTQCARIVEEFGLLHLSAGDLLRAHMKSGTPDGNMVADMIKQGQIVPSRVTISLLEAAMLKGGKQQVLIDGFPRNEENRAAFESQTGIQPEFVLFFDCPEAVMEARLLARQEGRTDDNIDTIRRRFKVFLDSSMPIIKHYEQRGKVRKIHADRPPEQVYQDVRPFLIAMQTADSVVS